MRTLTPEQVELARDLLASGPQEPERSPLYEIPIAALHQLAKGRLGQIADVLDGEAIAAKTLLVRFIEDADELLEATR